jgi:hypothetical protein
MKRVLVVVIAAGALGVWAQASAHHSFPGTYLEDRQLTVEGELVHFLFRNPHSFVHVVTLDSRKQPQRWVVEWIGSGMLEEQGVTPRTLKPGDRVVITGSPGSRMADHALRMRSIFRPRDGWRWTGKVD